MHPDKGRLIHFYQDKARPALQLIWTILVVHNFQSWRNGKVSKIWHYLENNVVKKLMSITRNVLQWKKMEKNEKDSDGFVTQITDFESPI